MKTTTTAALQSAAIARATSLCDAAFKTISAGRKTFVKGKPAMVAYSDEGRAQLRRLQLGAFDSISLGFDATAHYADEGVVDAATEDAFLPAAFEVYAAAGRAEVERRFA